MADDQYDDPLARFAEALARLSDPGGGLSRFADLIGQFSSPGRSPLALTPVANAAGGGPSPLPVPTAAPLASGSPVATALQPLNVQMAELIGAVKAILAAVLVGQGQGGRTQIGRAHV